MNATYVKYYVFYLKKYNINKYAYKEAKKQLKLQEILYY